MEHKSNEQLLKEIEQLKAENKVFTKNKEIFRIISEDAVDYIAISTFSLPTKYIYISPSVKNTLGYEVSEMINKSFFDFVHPDDKDFIIKLVKKYLKQTLKSIIKPGDPNITETIEYRFLNKKGQWCYIQSNISFIGKDLFAISRDITKQKELETALADSEKKFRNIFSEAPFGIEYYNSEGQLVDANKECLNIFGVKSLEDIKGFKLFEDPNLSEESKSQVKKGIPYKYETEFDFELVKKHQLYPTTKSGRCYLNILITPFEITGQNDKGYLVHIEDISERKESEKKILESEEKYRLFFENNDAIILFIDPGSGEIIFSNQAASEYYGYSKEQFTGMNISNINTLPPHEIKLKMADALKRKQNYFVFNHKLASGEIRDVEIYQTKLFLNNNEIFSIIVHDVTLRNKAQNELISIKEKIEKSEKKFRELYEKSGDAILIIENGKFTGCNQATVEMLNYKTKNELLNVHPSELSPKKQPDGKDSFKKADEMMETALKNGTHRFEWNHKKSDGEIFPVEVLLTAILNEPDEKIIHAVWRDITERKRAELKLKKALKKAKESDRLKSAFLANMSHEIRTPMNGILGFADLLKEPGISGDDQQKYISVIEKSGERMLNIINDLIEISKVESGLMEVVISETNINQQIEYIYTFFKPEVEKKGMQLLFSTPLPEVEANIFTDREKLFAILSNLVKNAIKYSNFGTIELGYKKKKKIFRFYVKDTGIGIPEEKQTAIFDRFIQADINDTRALQGAGLGLSISKAYVEMLGGEIGVKSEPGKGSKFYFTIPINSNIKRQNNETISANSEKITEENRKLKILIAEDEETADLHLTIVLKNIQKEILHAKNGIEALEIVRKNPDIDVILMDIRMPELNGYDTTRKIREFNKEVIIIAQTAFAITGDREKALEVGCNDYISKPIDKNLLLKLIIKHVKKSKS